MDIASRRRGGGAGGGGGSAEPPPPLNVVHDYCYGLFNIPTFYAVQHI